MGEQRVDAGLLLRRVENKFSLSILLLYRVVAGNLHLSERLAIRCDAISEQRIIHGIYNYRDAQPSGQSGNRQSLQKMLDSDSQR